MAGATAQKKLFLICAIGSAGGATRQRADDVFEFIVAPAAEAYKLDVLRSDKDPTPGHVTSQIIRYIVDLDVIVADLTGRNPNVFYEVACAHCFGRPLVLLVDNAEELPFDTQHERTIVIGAGTTIGARQAQDAVARLKETLEIVLKPDYKPSSLVSQTASTASLQALAPANPIAGEIAALSTTVDTLSARMGGLDELGRKIDGIARDLSDVRSRVPFSTTNTTLGTGIDYSKLGTMRSKEPSLSHEPIDYSRLAATSVDSYLPSEPTSVTASFLAGSTCTSCGSKFTPDYSRTPTNSHQCEACRDSAGSKSS